MGETFTLNGATNHPKVNNEVANENLEGDDLIFYHSLRAELDSLEMNPKLQTIHYILDHSKSLR